MRYECDHDVATDVARVLRARGYALVELRDELPPDNARRGGVGSRLRPGPQPDCVQPRGLSCSSVAARTKPKPAGCSSC